MKWNKTRKILLLCGLFAFGLVVLAPLIYKIAYWTVRGTTFSTAGMSFPLPSGWVNAPRDWRGEISESITLLRLPNTIFAETPAAITFYQRQAQVPEAEAKAFRRWRSGAANQLQAKGYTITGTREFTTPAGIVCIEMNRPPYSPEVTCMFEVNRLMVDYRGDDSFTSEFYTMISSGKASSR